MDVRLVVRTCLVVLLAAFAMTPLAVGMPTAAAVGPPGQELLQVPMRWCAVQGSDAQANPGSVGEPTTNDYLWRRHERASDRVFIPGAGITFRSAFAAAIGAESSFPVIADPRPPASGGAGQLGDILSPAIDDTELKDAFAACNRAWDALAVQFKTPLVGFAGVNLRNFVDADGNVQFLRGQGYFDDVIGNWCANPPTISFGWNGEVGVADYSTIIGFDPMDLTTAHELGHVLGLGHGNGLDDDDDGVYDDSSSTKCDPTENEGATPFSIMSNGNDKRTRMSALQRQTTRTFALNYSGTKKDPPAALLPADTTSDQRTDTIHEVGDAGIDLTSLAIADNAPQDTTIVSLALYGLIPLEDVENRYLFFADLDDDPGTGGMPADLGFPTAFEGAELVTQVVVGPGHDATPTVWVFRDGAFEEIQRDFTAVVTTKRDSESGVDVANGVAIAVPNDVRGPMAPTIRLQAVAEQLAGAQELDRLPDGAPIGWVPGFVVQPEFPVCAATPDRADPGDSVLVEVAGLLPNAPVHVVLGDATVATGATDDQGNGEIEFVLPGDTRAGPRLVTVGVDGTALTADCMLTVRGEVERDEDGGFGRADHPVVGAWQLERDEAAPGSPPAVALFFADGAYVEFDADPASSDGVGTWRPTGERTAEVTFVSIMAGQDAAPAGLATVRAAVEVAADDQNLGAAYTVQFGGGDEHGPGSVVGRRIAAEPMGTSEGPLFPDAGANADEPATPAP